MDESQRRAWPWLGTGPLWMPRAARVAADDAAEPGGDRGGQGDASAAWESLRREVSGCELCSLCATRTQTVFGVGREHARCLIIGEAPGAEEDRRGEPFVGRAGELLDLMIGAIGHDRQRDVFIANVLKCRPPDNRDPAGEEVVRCQPFLVRQVELIAPVVIVALGRFAAQSLLSTDASIASLRGRAQSYRSGEREIPVVVTYHPAYLLRTPLDKAKAWRDLCLVAEILNAAPAGQ
ncbi:MAG: uracil-DNA glycosylase [Burkholderiaceae bacterium]|nr:uracil-DNA glycosylase [Burkholderiaceae bacterium]